MARNAYNDDELDVLRPQFSGGNRVTTPSKLVGQNRCGSNPRSSSATKLIRAINETDTAVRAPSRATSRRKDRRFDNDNMLGLRRILTENGVEPLDDVDENGNFITSRVKFGLRVNWKSLFSELFNTENSNERESFRTCSNAVESVRVQRSIPIRKDQWAEAESAWYRIENRLRAIVVRSLQREEFCFYVRAVEAVLLYFLAKQEAPPHSQVPEAFGLFLEQHIEHLGLSLKIVLKDSSFHRLLLHAVCQFYGLKSKSTNDEKGRRMTLITPHARSRNRDSDFVIDENLSLVGYVIATKLKVCEAVSAEKSESTSISITDGINDMCISAVEERVIAVGME